VLKFFKNYYYENYNQTGKAVLLVGIAEIQYYSINKLFIKFIMED
tara:strand:- start:424 stop:558 length:135 start_codon:yes stop_codon:yes gene_type:complete